MNYSIGEFIFCNIEILNEGKSKISFSPNKDSKIEKAEFLIVGVDEVAQTYKIILEDNMIGWNIGAWHVKHLDIDEKFLGKKFSDISESMILE